MLAAAAIVMNTDGLIVFAADSTVLANIPYSTALDAALAQLSEVTGVVATVTVHPGDEHCVPETTRYDLGGLVLSTPSRSPEAQFSVRVEAAGLATGVDLQFTNGMQVGSSLDEVRSAIPGIRTEAWPDGVVVAYFDLRGDLDDYSSNSDPYGGLAVVRDGVVVSFSAPHHHFYDC